MTPRAEIREFLISRRARVTPTSAGLPGGGARRVPGLRREEAAVLAGVSVDYYVRLERGDATGVSDSVVEGLTRALRLDAAERAHLVDLLRASAAPLSRRTRRTTRSVHASLQRVLDGMTGVPAFISDTRLDLVAVNPLWWALYADLGAERALPQNLARYTFLDPRARTFYVDWNAVADMTVALLRASAGRDPLDRELTALVGELAVRSEPFRARWAAHHVQRHTSGVKRMRHPVVGDLELSFDSMDLAADPGLTITVYTAEPGSSSEEGLGLLGSWVAPEPERTAARPGDGRTAS